jgi:hypothetical protein
MQIFVYLPSGKTVSVNCCLETTVGHVIKIVNALHLKPDNPVSTAVLKSTFYEEEHPMKVPIGTVLENDNRLTQLFERGILKEVTLMVF